MDLFNTIKNSPHLRPNALPAGRRQTGIICFKEAFPSILDVLLNEAQAIFVIDAQQKDLDKMTQEIHIRQKRPIPVFPFNDVSIRIDLVFVFYHHNLEYHALGHTAQIMNKVGYESFYTFMPIPYNSGITTNHNPDYYHANKESLESVFAMLEDDESKSVFAARIRSITTGHIGFLKVSRYDEYFHPSVQPEIGNVIIDGGVSAYVGPQEKFLKVVGAQGKWFGFEPDPLGFATAKEKIEKACLHNNWEIIPMGLWNKHDKLHFEILGQGTHVCKDKINSVACDVLSIDEFVKARFLEKVDFIKLDVEGAEFNALKGAIKTIINFRPKLAISLYHQPQDLYLIPLFLKEICADYIFYLGHHHSSLHETILYGQPRNL
jgi:FkbM family methyltransferase